MRTVPDSRVRVANAVPAASDGAYVLYWMTANRRLHSNFALQHARDRAAELGVPLLVFEPLRLGHEWSSARLHAFVLDGMADNARDCGELGVAYYPYVEPSEGAAHGLLEALAEPAALVVTDEFPCYFLPAMVQAAAGRIQARLEVVDSNGILPLSVSERAFPTAHAFRRFLQKSLREHLIEFPEEQPLAKYDGGVAGVPAHVIVNWPAASPQLFESDRELDLAFRCDVDVVERRGGTRVAAAELERFLDGRLSNYDENRNDPRSNATTGLSPYLHFGHASSHSIVGAVLEREGWDIGSLAPTTNGSRAGWWGVSAAAEALLDQIVTWRELGYVFCYHQPEYRNYASLPDWARVTLAEHAGDERPHVYTLEDLDAAETHDDLWNAAQRQLIREGFIHNYLRMLWGKKILEWSSCPEAAFEAMEHLNNRYALDGRNPNSYSGISWVLGRFDRAWGPERPIFGKIRYMSSDNTAKKLRVRDYVTTYSG